jgi:hypothetical protein
MLFQIVVDGGDAYSVVIAKTSSGKESFVKKSKLDFRALNFKLDGFCRCWSGVSWGLG